MDRTRFPPPLDGVASVAIHLRLVNASRDDVEKTYSSSSSDELFDYETVYREVFSPDRTVEIITGVSTIAAETAAFFAAQTVLTRLTKRAFDRALRYTGQRLSGHASSALLRLGLRAGVSRVVEHAISRLSARVMLALAATSSGVGVALGIAELVSLALEVALLAGWDPGNYRSEFDNTLYDDMMRAWIERKNMVELTAFEPEMLLTVFSANRENPNDANDASVTRDGPTITNARDAPRYFADFPRAVEAMVRDLAIRDADNGESGARVNVGAIRTNNNDDDDDDNDDVDDGRKSTSVLCRARPFVSNEPTVCSIVWTMQYFARRTTNSLGQRVTVEHRRGDVTIDDDLVVRNVTSNGRSSVQRR